MIEQSKNSTHHEGADKPAAIASGGILHHLRVSVVATIVLAVICCGIYPLLVWGLSQAIFHNKANGSLIKDDKGNVIGSSLIGQGFSDAKYFHGRPSQNSYDAANSSGSNLGPTSAKLINGTTKPSAQPSTPPSTPPSTQPAAVVDNDGIKLRILHYCDDNAIKFEASRDGKVIAQDAFEKEFKNPGGWDEVKLILAFNDSDHPVAIKSLVSIASDAVTASASGLDPHISVDNAIAQAQRVADARHVSRDTIAKLIAQNTEGRDLGIFGEPGVNVVLLNLALDKEHPAPH